MNRLTVLALAPVLLLSACRRNPIERLTNPYPDGAVPQSSGVYTLYDEELKTGGGVSFNPGGENQSINFADHDAPHSGANQIRYVWNGGDVFDSKSMVFEHVDAGFSLVVPVHVEDVPTTAGKNLASNGYTKLTMWVRGTVSQNTHLRIEGPTDGVIAADRVDLTADQIAGAGMQVTLPITQSNFSDVKVYMTATFIYDQPPRTTAAGEGGTVLIDDIRYER